MVLPLIAMFVTFRSAVDPEMPAAGKLGVAQERKMAERKLISYCILYELHAEY